MDYEEMFCGEPHENLATAIVLLAVSDYRKALKRIEKMPDDVDTGIEISDIERFFKSEWFDLLSPLDGNFLIDKLRREAKDTKACGNIFTKCIGGAA